MNITYRNIMADGSVKFMQLYTVNVFNVPVYCVRTWWEENELETVSSYTIGEATSDGVMENVAEIIASYKRDGFRIV